MSPRVDVSMTDAAITEFLQKPLTGVLTTLEPDGWPHSAGMWFALADGAVQMWTYAKSQKAINLRRDPRAAFLVEDGVGYMELKGVLIRGRVAIVDDIEAILAIGLKLYDRYTLPATGVKPEDGPIVELRRQAAKRVGLVLPMARVATWDHAKLVAGSG